MPDDEVQVEGQEGGGESQSQTEPSYVKREDFDTLAGLVRGMQDTMAAGFNALAAQRQATGQTQVDESDDDVTDEELEEALNHGTGASKFRKMQQASERRIAKQIAALQAEGTGAIANVVKQSATATLPHYKKYQKEIDEAVASMPANQRMNPQVYKVAHDIVVGSHVEEIVAESLERMKRGDNPKDPAVGIPGSGGRGGTGGRSLGTGGHTEPDKDQLDALASSGRTADGFAQRLGYQSWVDYVAKTAVETA